MKQLVFSGWHFVRWLRLGLGLLLVTGAIVRMDMIAGFLGGLLLVQSVFNLGCAGGSCAVDYSKNKKVACRQPGDEN